MDYSSWVKDGSTTTPPVTESTPAQETPAPTPEPQAPPPNTVAETPASTPESSGPTRDPATGKFVSGSTASATPEPPATQQQVEDAIEAILDGKPFKIPKGVQFPWKRGNETGTAPITEIAKSPFFEKDYRIKTAEAAQLRRRAEQEIAQARALVARTQAREAYLREQEERLKEAQLDPEKWERYERHMDMLQKSPEYRKTWEDALAKRESDAELGILRQQQEAQAVEEAQSAVIEAIDRLAGEFPDADKERVRSAYADALIQGRLPLSEDALRHVFKQEAEQAGALRAKVREAELSPLQKELADLKAELAAMKKAGAAGAHNASVKDKIDKSKVPGAPAGGSPPAPATKKPLEVKPGESFEERARRWGRDT